MSGPLQKQLMNIPLAGGIDAKSDPLAVDSDHFLTVLNGRYTDAGAIKKRPGSRSFGSTGDTGITGLAHRGADLVAITPQALRVYNQDSDSWVSGGTLDTGTITTEAVLTSNTASTAVAYSRRTEYLKSLGGQELIAYNYVDSSDRVLRLFRNTAGALETQTTAASRRVFAAAGSVYVSVNTLATNVSEFDPITGAAATYVASPGVPYDMVAISSTEVVIAYLVAGSNMLYKYNTSSHTFTGNVFLGAVGTTISIQLSAVSGGAVCAVQTFTSAANTSLLQFVQLSTMTLGTSVSTSIVCNLGCTVVQNTSGTNTWHVWALDNSTGGGTLNIRCQTVTVTGTFPAGLTVTSTTAFTRVIGIGYTGYFAARPSWANSKSQATFALIGGTLPTFVRMSSSNQLTGNFLTGYVDTTITATGTNPWVPGSRTNTTYAVPVVGAEGPVGLGSFPTVYKVTEDFAGTEPLPTVADSTSLFIGGALPAVYSGAEVHEQGYVVSPAVVSLGQAAGGALTTGQTYTVRAVFEFINSAGQLERSAMGPPASFTLSGGNTQITYTVPYGPFTNRSGAYVTLYMTAYINGVMSTEMYAAATWLASGGTAGSMIIPSTGAAISDAVLATRRTLYALDELDADAPPPLKRIVRWADRLMGVDASVPTRVWYSKPVDITSGVAPEWSADSTLDFPPQQGDIMGIEPMDDKLVVLQEDAVSYISGSGPDATGDNGTFTIPILIAGAQGCTNAQSILKTDDGVWYQSQRGLWFIDRGLGNTYRGAAVESWVLNNTIMSCVQANEYGQLMWFFAAGGGARGDALVYDTFVQKWSVYDYADVDSAVMYNGGLLRAYRGAIKADNGDGGAHLDDDVPYMMQIQTAWLKPAGPQGLLRAYRVGVLGRFLGPHYLTLAVHYNYEENSSQQVQWQPEYANVLSTIVPYQVRWRLPAQKCESIRLTFTTSTQVTVGGFLQDVDDACALSSLVLEFGILPGLYRLPQRNSV